MIKILENENELNDLLKEKRVLIDFNAAWCAPCNMLSPLLEKLANEYKDLVIVKIDVDLFPSIASNYRINSIPALIYYENGNIKNSNIGYAPYETLKRIIQ